MDGLFEVIPMEWVSGMNTCVWPPKHIKKREAARNSIEPGLDWSSFQIEMLAYKGDRKCILLLQSIIIGLLHVKLFLVIFKENYMYFIYVRATNV